MAAFTANSMTTLDPITPHPVNAVPFCVNAINADASACETILASPGAGYSRVITQIIVMTDEQMTVTIGEGNAGDGVTAVLFGPLYFGSEERVTEAGVAVTTPSIFIYKPTRPIKMTTNTILAADASAPGNVCVIVEGYVVTG